MSWLAFVSCVDLQKIDFAKCVHVRFVVVDLIAAVMGVFVLVLFYLCFVECIPVKVRWQRMIIDVNV